MVISEKKSIRKKLMAATAMLLVACIMLISSSYAWFTLSTAPEVKGITTTVGANGNLEIALADTTTWANPDVLVGSGVGTSMESVTADIANKTWGNLVDLSLETYGLSAIKLMPARLNVTAGEGNQSDKITTAAPLLTPVYGYDGRVSQLIANTAFALYNAQSKNFPTSNDDVYGVRAIGTSTALTERQISYRNAKVALAEATDSAILKAAQSLNENGSSLANIIIQHSVDATTKYSQEDVTVLKTVVNKLTDAHAELENALEAAVIGYAASKLMESDETNDTDVLLTATEFAAVETAIEAGFTVSGNVLTTKDSSVSITLPEYLGNAFGKCNEIEQQITEANTRVNSLTTDEIEWDAIKNALEPIINPANVKINGIDATVIKDNLQTLIDAVLDGSGIQVQMPSDSGVYANIAEFCGDYSAQVKLQNISYGDLTVKETTARMTTTTQVVESGEAAKTPYLKTISSSVGVAGAPEKGGLTNPTLTDTYGYAIDLYFRTNVDNSNLLLQTSATQRIYSESTTDTTQGSGSNMEFSATTTSFSNDDMKALMENIRVVFMDGSGNVLAYAMLDMNNASDTATGVKADLKLYEATVVTDAQNNRILTFNTQQVRDTAKGLLYKDSTGTLVYYNENTQQYVKKEDGTTYAGNDTINSGMTAVMEYVEVKDQIIAALPKNTAQKVTAMVYLDGDSVTNADVANAQTSMVGKLNLQFASDATLVPMDNTALKGDIPTTN